MALSINPSTPSSHSRLQVNVSQTVLGRVFERISSARRINSAADDAGGMGVSDKIQTSLRSLVQAGRNPPNATEGRILNGLDPGSSDRNIAPRDGDSESSVEGTRPSDQALETAKAGRQRAIEPPVPDPEPGPTASTPQSSQYRGTRLDILA